VQGAASDLEHAIEVFEQKGIRVSADAARRRLGTLRSTAALEPRIAAPAETGRARAARTLP
jgi:uncharacterized protein YggU (UPF0235/DUF167 family)